MKKYSINLSLLAAILLTGCMSEPMVDQVDEADLIPLNIDGAIHQVATKVTAQGFVDKDAIGLFAVNYSENNTVAGTLAVSGNQADNVKYVFDEANHKWVPVRSVYYKDVNTHADIYLYYPYQPSITDVNVSNFEVQKDQSSAATASALSGYEASDWMWGKGTDITPSESKVQITLDHQMSAVQVTLSEGSGFGSGEFESLSKSVIVTNTTRKATLDYATGTVTPLGSPQLDGIVMCPQSDGSFRAIVVPQTVMAETNLFSITIDGIAYGFKQNTDVAYQAGKQLQVTININKKSPSGDYELELADSQIIDWTEDTSTHGGEARQYYVVNITTPGTLGDLINAAGKNPDKIRNLKVVGNVNANDFYFMRDHMAILEAVNMKEAVIDNGKIPYGAFQNKTSISYFTFPEIITEIEENAFMKTKLSGALIIPDDVQTIGDSAFEGTLIGSVSLPLSLKRIGHYAFMDCTSLSGSLHLPGSLEFIGAWAFKYCNLSGYLSLPESLTYLGVAAFLSAGNFTGDLVIPAGVKIIYDDTFSMTTFSGGLKFKGNLDFMASDGQHGAWRYGAFHSCHFSGDLQLPEGATTIYENFFSNNNFTSISFPSTIKEIKQSAFYANQWLERIYFPEGLLSIGIAAFGSCYSLLSLELPSTLQIIQSNAFNDCYYISNISCAAIEPPTVLSGAFDGVAKDNFALQVPEQSIVRYQTESGWSDFRRITAHYDFSIGRTRLRLLNKGESRTYTLRCPALSDWAVDSKPDWVTISPSSGTGKTDITITVADMDRTSETFEVNSGSFLNPNYKNLAGRKGDIIFKLDDKEYTCELAVEQFDYDYADGQAQELLSASQGNGIDIVFIGEGYDAKDIAENKFTNDVEIAYEHFFNVEPYTTYKNYFNVYSVISKSDDSGIEDVNTVIDEKFTTVDECFKWAKNAKSGIDISKTVVIMLHNNPNYYGWTYMYSDGSALAVVPVSQQAYPRDFRGLIQHEAGGHAFGKLADEYIYHNAFITSCWCACCDHPSDEFGESRFGHFKNLGWFKNLSTYSDHNRVPWAHLIFNPNYSNRVDMYEGGYMHTRGIYRSEITSCMNNNIPYYSSISRQAIVERIKDYAGETFTLEDFYAHDSFAVGTKAASSDFDWTFGVDPDWSDGPEHGSIIFMGEKPNLD